MVKVTTMFIFYCTVSYGNVKGIFGRMTQIWRLAPFALPCAIEAGCKYYVTTDDKLLNKIIDNIIILDPITLIKR
ncbi:MAG: hypothetical protein LBP76_14085, partial [Treponema sp.]|nr:hypothetical protein [Treponema sp.]